MKITAEPRSDQWNAEDFLGGSRVFTVAGVKTGTAEQKYDIELVEGEGRVWRPPLTMLRVLLVAWGDEASAWIGRRVELFQDPTVRFGKDAVGGIRIAALSHIDAPLNLKLTATRGKRVAYTVQPLKEAPKPNPTPDPTQDPAREWRVEADALKGRTDDLRALYMDAQAAGADPDTLTHIKAQAGA